MTRTASRGKCREMFFQSRVRVWRPTEVVDSRGMTKLKWVDTPESFVTVTFPVELQPNSTTTETSGGVRLTTISDYTLFTPVGKDIDVAPTDRIVRGKQVFGVVGVPRRWPGPGDSIDHVEIDLKEIIG